MARHLSPDQRAERVLEVPVIGAEHAPNLIRYLEQHGMVVKPAPDDPESLVKSQKEPVIIRVPETFGEHWQVGRPAEIEVIIDSSIRVGYPDVASEGFTRGLR